MENKLYLNFIFILIFGYGFMVVLGNFVSPHSEIFPFFHWGLYVSTPQSIEKDFIDIYDNKLLENKKDFYDYTAETIGKVTARSNLYLLKTCKGKPCFESAKERVMKLLPKNSYAVFYSINELKEIDTLGYFSNSTFKSHLKK